MAFPRSPVAPGAPAWPASVEEHVLLDPNTFSKDGTVSLGGWSVSWDGKKVAFIAVLRAGIGMPAQ